MDTIRQKLTVLSIALAACAATPFAAQAQMSRGDVQAELLAAQRAGDVAAPGDSGRTLAELYPTRYPKATAEPVSRAQVEAELEDARRSGALIAGGDSGRRLAELFPQRYPAANAPAGRTRAQVAAETLAAARAGELPSVGDLGLAPHDRRAHRDADALRGRAVASASTTSVPTTAW